MSKRLIVAVVVIGLMILAIPTYAAVQNVKVSGDLNMMGVGRRNFQLDGGSGNHQSAILSIARLKADFDLTDKVAATLRLLNERAWGQEGETNTRNATQDTAIHLDLAYVTLKEFLYSPQTLTVGRQNLRFGNAFIIGDPDTNGTASVDSALHNPNAINGFGDLSARKSFDAIRSTWNYDPLTIDAIYSKIDENSSIANDNVDLYGVNANYVVNKDLTAEAYWFSRVRQGPSLTGTATAVDQSDKAHTIGIRGVYTGVKNLTLGLENAVQLGSRVYTANAPNAGTYPDDFTAGRTDGKVAKRDAWALQAMGSYVWADNKYKPSVNGSFTHLSGAKDDDEDTYRGWDPMFEDQAGGTIFNKILGYSNANFFQLGASVKPWEDINVAFDYYHIRLDRSYRNTAIRARNLDGIAASNIFWLSADEKHLGDEWDVNFTYDYTEDVQLGLSLGWFVPGPVFFNRNDATANQVIGKMKVTF